jgi:hypothetical protein
MFPNELLVSNRTERKNEKEFNNRMDLVHFM